ncbi:hypothetical protein SARC_15386, partial [Sphaeroforma arctica JP610]
MPPNANQHAVADALATTAEADPELLQFWKDHLSSPPFLPLPTDYPRHNTQ